MYQATRALRYAAVPANKPVNPWTKTLNLPKSSFPARLDPKQISQLNRTASEDLYQWQSVNRSSGADQGAPDTFTLRDGPPYANGPLHTGHLLNKVLKDLIVRTHLSRGRRVTFQPGWDCHGLPIELKALQAAGRSGELGHQTALSPVETRSIARQLAAKTVEEHTREFRSWAILADWDRPYLTMDQDYIVRQLQVFKAMVAKGLIYRQFRPVYWSPSSQSALAEAELEYDDNHKVLSAFIKFPITASPFLQGSGLSVDDCHALVWTTTPWTLPANMAIAVGNDIEYALIETKDTDEPALQGSFIIATDRIDAIRARLPSDATITILKTMIGCDLIGSLYKNVMTAETCQIVKADFVTATAGTGLVHMAPGHGTDDYTAWSALGNTEIRAPVDDHGKFTNAAFPHAPEVLAGLDVQTNGAKAVLDLLANKSPDGLPISLRSTSSFVLAVHDHTHKSPIDWRTKQPVIIRATEQWFAGVDKLMGPATSALDNVIFIPEVLRTKLADHINGRRQWCVSRQRAWGVPIPALFDGDGQAVLTSDSIQHMINVIQKRGVGAWWSDPFDDPAWLPSDLEPGTYTRGRDTMDVWFDSGTAWASSPGATVSGDPPTVVEGSDQHRGWFQSSLLTSVAQQLTPTAAPEAPYSTVVTHGFVLDQHGRKMSKSLGNVVAPSEILSGAIFAPKSKSGQPSPTSRALPSPGPDVLHLWVASNDYTRDISLGPAFVQSVHQILQKYRVTFKWLLGVLADYPAADLMHDAHEHLSGSPTFADYMVLHQLAKTCATVSDAQEKYAFHKAVAAINRFINVDLSATYFEIIKDRIYAGDAQVRKDTQRILFSVLNGLLDMLAPITPLLVQEVSNHLPDQLQGDPNESGIKRITTTMSVFANLETSPEMDQDMQSYQALSTAIKAAQEEARRAGCVGSGLACSVEIQLPRDVPAHFSDWIQQLGQADELRELFVVSGVTVVPQDASIRRLAEDEVQDPDLKASVETYRRWRKSVAWSFEAEYNSSAGAWYDGGKEVMGKVVVLPAQADKCARCWQYTAPAGQEICSRCQDGVGRPEEADEDVDEGDPFAELDDEVFDSLGRRGPGRLRPRRRRG